MYWPSNNGNSADHERPLRSFMYRKSFQTASRKATGPDEAPAELFTAGGETVLDRMHRMCVAI